MNEDILKSLALLIGGALMGAIAGLLVSWISLHQIITVIIVIIAIACIAYGLSFLSKLWHCWNICGRKQRLKIGILKDIPKNEEEGWVHTNVYQEKWKDEIERQVKNKEIEVKLIAVKDNFDPYTAIINPYGGVYPEHNLGKLETLDKILKYVAEGGLFVNVADIPGYFAYNELLKRKLDITPPAFWDVERDQCGRGKLIPRRPFELTPLMDKIGLRGYAVNLTWNLEFDGKCKEVLGSGIANTNVRRVLVIEKNVKSVVKPIQIIDEEKRTPIVFVEYGNGEFLLSLIWINEQDRSVKEELVTALAKLIVHATQRKSSKHTTKYVGC